MKKLKLFTVTFVLFLATGMYGQTLENGIYYFLSGTDATVASNPSGYSGDIVIPNTVTISGITYNVTSIANNAFRDCTGLTSINIPKKMISIPSTSFNGCTNLTTLNYNAENCATISSSIAWGSLTTVIIGENVKHLPNGAFKNRDNLTTVYFNADSCATLSNSGESWTKVTTVIIGENVKVIPMHIFRGCTKLNSIIIPNGVTKIGDAAFRSCSLTSLTIPSSVDTIGSNGVFMDNKLTFISIPNSVKHIGADAFDNCPLKKLVFECGEKPLSIESGNPFNNCPLDTVFVGRDISSSTGWAISIDLSLNKSLTFGECITYIGDIAFNYLNTSKITCLSTTPPQLNENPFRNMIEIQAIVVPFGSGKLYRTAPIWEDFNIVELPPLTEVTETPTTDGLTVEWQPYEYATGYRLIIYSDVAHTDTLHIYEFNAAGQLVKETNLRAASPSFSYTVTGLNSGTGYFYALETLGVNSVVLESQSGSFTTLGSATGIYTTTSEKTITGYYNIMGMKLKHEPQSGSYIVLYNDGSTEKRMKR